MNQVARPLQVERVLAQGIVRSGPDHRIEILAVLVVLLAHRERHAPGGILLAAHDLRDALRSSPAHLADADGVSEHDGRCAAPDRGIVEDPHGRDVDHEPGARRVRQNELRRNHDLPALPRQPGVDLGIGAHDLLVPDVEATRDIAERVVLAGRHHLHDADDVLSGVELEALVGHGRGQRRRRRRGRRWGRRRVPKRGEERAPRDQQARQRGSGAGRGGNLHGGIMTEFAGARRASVMRYSSTGWLGSSWSLWCRPGKCRPSSAATPSIPAIEPSP